MFGNSLWLAFSRYSLDGEEVEGRLGEASLQPSFLKDQRYRKACFLVDYLTSLRHVLLGRRPHLAKIAKAMREQDPSAT
jgi:hypothetical protein